jgi:hypothetical protein
MLFFFIIVALACCSLNEVDLASLQLSFLSSVLVGLRAMILKEQEEEDGEEGRHGRQ